MRNLVRTLAVLFAVSTLGGVMTHADAITYDFSATGTPYGDISFSLPASPTPISFTADSFSVLANDLSVGGEIIKSEVLDFFILADEGGAAGSGIHAEGPQLFTGSTANPTFTTGDFKIGDNFNLAITDPAISAVPEPYTLFLFGTGVLGLGVLAKRRLQFMQETE